MKKILILIEEISAADYVKLAQTLAQTCDRFAQVQACDILLIAAPDGSPDPQDRPNLDPSAN